LEVDRNGHTRTLPELNAELKALGATRLALFQAEMREKWNSLSRALGTWKILARVSPFPRQTCIIIKSWLPPLHPPA
jgi:hypothetical protein